MKRGSYAASVLFIQSNPSQLDEYFYALLSARTARITIALLNSGARTRRTVDPELGFVPEFPQPSGGAPTILLRGEHEGGARQVLSLIFERRPDMVVVQDQSWPIKLYIACQCRVRGIAVALRSDKNSISATARKGVGRILERLLVQGLFNRLAPVSPLTVAYYGWKRNEAVWWFPYSSARSKYAPTEATRRVRDELRASLGISPHATVFLVVAKFVTRENPTSALLAFARTAAVCRDAVLVMVGAGVQEEDLRSMTAAMDLADRVRFLGYVPYVRLHEYFWCSDVLVHLARSEPWGVSAQDALVAKMGLITSTNVGAGVCHLVGSLSRFVVGADDIEIASRLMIELAGDRNAKEQFAPAWSSVNDLFTAEALADWWSRRIGAA